MASLDTRYVFIMNYKMQEDCLQYHADRKQFIMTALTGRNSIVVLNNMPQFVGLL